MAAATSFYKFRQVLAQSLCHKFTARGQWLGPYDQSKWKFGNLKDVHFELKFLQCFAFIRNSVCWVSHRKDLYESIRRPFLQGTYSLKVYVLCVYMMYMYSVAQFCLTLCNPMDYSLPGSSGHGILQARILEWVAISYSRGSSWLKDQTHVSCVSCTGRQILYHCRFFTWEAPEKKNI